MNKQIKISVKIIAILSLIIPLLYCVMFLPIWNGKELTKVSFNFIDFIQIIAFVSAAINTYFVFYKKLVKNQIIFVLIMFVSATLFCLLFIFFVENLVGMPLFPPQD